MPLNINSLSISTNNCLPSELESLASSLSSESDSSDLQKQGNNQLLHMARLPTSQIGTKSCLHIAYPFKYSKNYF